MKGFTILINRQALNGKWCWNVTYDHNIVLESVHTFNTAQECWIDAFEHATALYPVN